MKASMTSIFFLAVIFVLSCMTSMHVGATVVGTCRAAADSDKRVDYQFCVSQLGRHHDSPDADTWGLAKIAALIGVNNADLASDDIKNLEAKPTTDPKTKSALDQCLKLYDSIGFAFAFAQDELNKRDYAAGKQRLGEAISLTQQCEGAFRRAGVRSPLTQRNNDSVSLAIISTAITNLIK